MSARARGIAVALVALAVSAACDRGTRSEVGRETAAAVDKAGDAASDARITMTVQAKYFASNEVKGREIDVDTSNGVVTLKGTVNSHSEHDQAVALARSTDGVREVRDQLQMMPGNQDVRGTVGREMSKVGREANEVGEKVGREANRIGEKASREASNAGQHIEDAWITVKIQSKYFANADIKSRTIDVDTKNGVVTLNGAVGTPAARELAMNLARETDGVTKVVDNLKIDPS